MKKFLPINAMMAIVCCFSLADAHADTAHWPRPLAGAHAVDRCAAGYALKLIRGFQKVFHPSIFCAQPAAAPRQSIPASDKVRLIPGRK